MVISQDLMSLNLAEGTAFGGSGVPTTSSATRSKVYIGYLLSLSVILAAVD